MATPSFAWQTWNSGPFTLERKPGTSSGTVILRFHGPFTMRDVYSSLPTMTWSQMLDLKPREGEEPPVKNILDLTDCTYIDSSGLGMIVTHHVRCQKHGVRMIACGLSPRVRQVFKITRVDAVIPIAGTLEEAEIN